MISSRFLSV